MLSGTRHSHLPAGGRLYRSLAKDIKNYRRVSFCRMGYHQGRDRQAVFAPNRVATCILNADLRNAEGEWAKTDEKWNFLAPRGMSRWSGSSCSLLLTSFVPHCAFRIPYSQPFAPVFHRSL